MRIILLAVLLPGCLTLPPYPYVRTGTMCCKDRIFHPDYGMYFSSCVQVEVAKETWDSYYVKAPNGEAAFPKSQCSFDGD